jgi:iron complex outermembrane receptor protein
MKQSSLRPIPGAVFALITCMQGAAVAQSATSATAAELDASGRGRLETVIVTATKRLQPMQDVPQTLSVFSEKAIKDTGAQDFAGLVNSMAGVELRQEQAGQGGVAIRGISELNMMNLYGGTGSATGMYIDEMPLSAGGRFPGLSSFDISRVEVLKGPQGTLFGEGSLAGTVRFIANKPVFGNAAGAVELTGSRTAGGGDNHAAQAMVNVPLGESAAARMVAFRRVDSGYMDARITDGTTVFDTRADANTQRSQGGRVMLRAEPFSDLLVSATFLTNDARNGTRSRGPEVGVGSFSVPEHQRDKLNAFNLTLEYEMSFASLVASVSSSDRKIGADTDQAQSIELINGALAQLAPLASQLGVQWVSAATAAHSFHNYNARNDAVELRMVSNAPGALKWTLGAFYKNTDTLHTAEANSIAPVPGASWAAITNALTRGALSVSDPQKVSAASRIKQTAVFGEISNDFSKELQLLAGGRLFKETRRSSSEWASAFAMLSGGLPPGSSSSSASSTLFNPKVTASYKWSRDVLGYATHSRGFRSGGQNEYLPFTPNAAPDYKPETLANTEFGLKTNLLDNSASVNLSVYRMKWKDLQQVVEQGIGGIGKALGNVGSATSSGLDVEVRWMPTRQLDLSLAASLQDAKLANDVVLPPSAGDVTVPAGTRIPGTAKKTLSLGGSYRVPLTAGLNGFLGGRTAYRSEASSDLRHFHNKTPAHATLDLRLGVEGKQWQLTVFVDNAANRKVAVREDFDGPDVLTQQRNFFWARPRTVGLTLRASL